MVPEGWHFKKKRVLDDKRIEESLPLENMGEKPTRKYKTRQQTLKSIDDKFEKEFKQPFG